MLPLGGVWRHAGSGYAAKSFRHAPRLLAVRLPHYAATPRAHMPPWRAHLRGFLAYASPATMIIYDDAEAYDMLYGIFNSAYVSEAFQDDA